MKIKIILNNDSRDVVGFFNIRKNTTQKTLIAKVKEYISKEYNCNIRRLLPTGTIDFATGNQNISYILFGENIPFKQIKILKIEK